MKVKPNPHEETQDQEQTSGAKWVEEMREHFHRNGFYRADDLQRLIGDPRDHVEIQPSTESPFNIVPKKQP